MYKYFSHNQTIYKFMFIEYYSFKFPFILAFTEFSN